MASKWQSVALAACLSVAFVIVPLYRFAARVAAWRMRAPPEDAQGQWVGLGPAPVIMANESQLFSARVGAIAVAPTSLAHWLVGVGNGGVWESTDGGGTFRPLSDGAPTLATGSL